MTSVAIQIIMHGLIALVPINTPDGVNHMTALLVDARNPPPDRTCVMAHTPTIQFPASSADCTSAPVCQPAGPGQCLCTLNRHEISILPDTEPSMIQLLKSPRRVLPFNNQDSYDFAYVGNLAYVKSVPLSHYTLNQDFLSPTPPDPLVARFRFPIREVLACDLATRPEAGADQVHPLNFRPVGIEEKGDEMSQALAQRAIARVAVPVDTGAGEVLKLVLTPFPGTLGTPMEFKLPILTTTLTIILTNGRPQDHAQMKPDDPCDNGVAWDFAYFYDLVQTPPAWKDRPVPHISYSMSKSLADLNADKCKEDGSFFPMSRPICPMASFNPPASD